MVGVETRRQDAPSRLHACESSVVTGKPTDQSTQTALGQHATARYFRKGMRKATRREVWR